MKGAKVEVYLNKKAMGKSPKRIYSIRSAAGRSKGKVIASSKRILMRNVEFVVREAGRRDTLARLTSNKGPTKTVHAFLRGEVVARGNHAAKLAKELAEKWSKSVRYNPVRNTSFVAQEQPVYKAEYAWVHEDDIAIN
jgi:hypothetical protein